MNKVIATAPGTQNSTAFQTNLNMSTHQVPFGTHGFTGDLVLEFDVNKPIEEVNVKQSFPTFFCKKARGLFGGWPIGHV